MTLYIPDENGELTALNEAASDAVQIAEQIPSSDLGAAFAKMFFSLAAIVILLFLTFWLLRKLVQNRLQKGIGNSDIQILEKRMISPKTMLYLIEVEGKKIVIAESHLEIKRLESFEKEP